MGVWRREMSEAPYGHRNRLWHLYSNMPLQQEYSLVTLGGPLVYRKNSQGKFLLGQDGWHSFIWGIKGSREKLLAVIVIMMEPLSGRWWNSPVPYQYRAMYPKGSHIFALIVILTMLGFLPSRPSFLVVSPLALASVPWRRAPAHQFLGGWESSSWWSYVAKIAP